MPRSSTLRTRGLVPLLLALSACSEPSKSDTAPPRPFLGSPSFVNGGFEDDMIDAAPSGWTVTSYTNPGGPSVIPPRSMADLNLQMGGSVATRVVGGATGSLQDGAIAGVWSYPRIGTRTAIVNDSATAGNVNSIKQSATITSDDVDPDDGRVHVRMVVASVFGDGGRPAARQPYQYIEARNVTRGTVLGSDFTYSMQPFHLWLTSSVMGPHSTKFWQIVDFSGDPGQLAPGDTVEIEAVAAGGPDGDDSRLYVDELGSRYPGVYVIGSGPARAAYERTFTYRFRYKNGTDGEAVTSTFLFFIPNFVAFQALRTSGLACDSPSVGVSGTVLCTIEHLAAGASGVIEVDVSATTIASPDLVSGAYFIASDSAGWLSGPKVVTKLGRPESVAVGAGDNQRAVVHSDFAAPLSVVVRDQDGNPYEGATVDFSAGSVGGATAQLASASAVTDARGVATVTATASDFAGTYAVTASVQGVNAPATFSLTNDPGPASTIAAQPSATPQTAQVDTSLAAPLAVLVRDSYGNVVPGVQVSFVTPGTGPTAVLSAASALSDALGVASVTAKAGTVKGDYEVTASVSGVAQPAVFSLTNQAGPPGKIAITNGDAQSSGVAAAFPQRLGVLVTDAFDNPLPAQRVYFHAPVTGPSALLRSAFALTDAGGHASVAADAGTAAGRYQVSASVTGVAQPALFQLTNHAGAPASITPDWRSARRCLAPDQAVELLATVRDRYKNPVPGVTVLFSSSDQAATPQQPSGASDESGLVRITVVGGAIASAAGVGAAVLAQADGVAMPARFPLSVALPAETAGTITRVAGTGQSARVGEPFKLALRVRASGPVTFLGPDSGPGAVFSAREVKPDESGVAMVTARANGVAGSYVVKAMLSDCDGTERAVSFALSNLPGPAASVRVEDALSTPQTAQAGNAFPRPLAVIVRDAAGNPVSGVDVTFAAPEMGARASLDAATVKTDAAGRAAVAASATSEVGEYAVTATVAGVEQPARFALGNAMAAPRTLEIVEGTLQTAPVTSAYASALTVIVRDAAGAPLADVPVTFAPLAAGGAQAVAVSAQEVRSDAQGRASVTLMANQARGAVLVSAAAAGAAAPVSFLVTNLPIPTGVTLSALGKSAGTAELPSGTVELRASVQATGSSVTPAGQLVIFADDGFQAVIDGNVATEASGRAGIEGVAATAIGKHRFVAIFLPTPDDVDRGSDTFAPSMSEVQSVDIAAPPAPPKESFDGLQCQCQVGAGRGAAPPTALLLLLGALALALRRRLQPARVRR